MCPMTVVEVSLPGTAITSTLMADPIPTTSGQEIGISQPIREAPVVTAEADALVHVLAPALVVDEPVAAKRTRMKGQKYSRDMIQSMKASLRRRLHSVILQTVE